MSGEESDDIDAKVRTGHPSKMPLGVVRAAAVTAATTTTTGASAGEAAAAEELSAAKTLTELATKRAPHPPPPPLEPLDVKTLTNPLSGKAARESEERPLTPEFLRGLNTDTAVNEILRYCGAYNTQLTSEQFALFVSYDKTFAFGGNGALGSAETPAERTRREDRDHMLVRLVRECITRFPEFSVTRSMWRAAMAKRYGYTEALLHTMLEDQHAALQKTILALTPLKALKAGSLSPSVFAAPAAQPPPTATAQTISPVAAPVTPQPAKAKRRGHALRVHRRHRSPSPRPKALAVWCCRRVLDAHRDEHGDAVGCALM